MLNFPLLVKCGLWNSIKKIKIHSNFLARQWRSIAANASDQREIWHALRKKI